MSSPLPHCLHRFSRGRKLPEELSRTGPKVPGSRRPVCSLADSRSPADGCVPEAARSRLRCGSGRCTDGQGPRRHGDPPAAGRAESASTGDAGAHGDKLIGASRGASGVGPGAPPNLANVPRFLREKQRGGNAAPVKVTGERRLLGSQLRLTPVSALYPREVAAPVRTATPPTCPPPRPVPVRDRFFSSLSSFPSAPLVLSSAPFLPASPASSGSSPCLSLCPTRSFSVASRIHFLNSRTRFQTVLHSADLAPPFLLLPLSSPRPLLAYHHRFRTRNKKRGSRFHAHPLPLPPPPLSPPRSDAAHMYVGSPLSASALATAAGQQPLPPPLLRHLQGLFPVFRGSECDPRCGVGPSGEASGLALLPPPSLVEPRHLEDLARRALHAHGEERRDASEPAKYKSDALFWKELAERVEKVRDVLPIESLVRLLTILTLRRTSGTVRPIPQVFQAFESQDDAAREGGPSKSETGLTLSNEALPCVRPVPPRLLLASTREFLEDLKKLSPPATAALAATFAWSNCTSSALLFALMERWAWQPSGEATAEERQAPARAPGQKDGRDEADEQAKTSPEDGFSEKHQGHLGDFTPADFALFVASLGHLASQQEAAHARHRRQARHAQEISGKQIMAAYRERQRRQLGRSLDSKTETETCHFSPSFFDGCCRYMANRAEDFSLFSFSSAARTLVENLEIRSLLTEAHGRKNVDSEAAGSSESLASQRHSLSRASVPALSRTPGPHVSCPTPNSVENLSKAICLFVTSWESGDKKHHGSLASRVADLLLVARLLRAASQCELYVHLHRALRSEAEGNQMIENRQKTTLGQPTPDDKTDKNGHQPSSSTDDVCKTLLAHITRELVQVHNELEVLPLLESTSASDEKGKIRRGKDDSATELTAHPGFSPERGFLTFRPETVYVRNELLAAAGESAAAVVRLCHAKSLLRTTGEVAGEPPSARTVNAEETPPSSRLPTGAGLAGVRSCAPGQPVERMQLDRLGQVKPETEQFVDAVDLILRERGAAGAPTEQMADLMELLAVSLPEKNTEEPEARSRWYRVGFGGKAEKPSQEKFSSLQALSAEIVRRYAALSVEQKRRIKCATKQIGWEDPYLNHCLGSFTSAVARQRFEATTKP
ncbi:conserved hypothetical protein [Neospora caninum Liverpool]|uniref:Uncharacterized protein n=1 Tax=Neospora caninum (strain Liverpool) TaxID=572307 RepID=F0VK67_NEOCL|nr:conserved hypothetical protein [Neospora caninum Liverpool]CBZ54468.1 conserved hypothetical protein [Neospora caninum Liverpool]CEL69180.1 TPA: hypothetical protein BN1204_048970 [Neospora caninum Liverpool]|eukprot:XP_003884498.1 conserved hypothetical protein [Neospora caninum Liverpool]